MEDYSLCGWRVHSELPLSELLPWRGDDRAPDVTIRLGEVPPLEEPVLCGPFLAVGRGGVGRFEVRDVAAFRVCGGSEITIDPKLPADAPDIGLFLFGSVFGLLCHQRGELPLHGSCVDIGGQAIVFAGPSGSGKSTLAAALVAQGHRLLADDVTVVRPAPVWRYGQVLAVPTLPRQKLWADTLDSLDLPMGRRLRSRGDMEKFEHCTGPAFQSQPLPLAMVCHLREARLASQATLSPLQGFDAMENVRLAVYRLRAGQQLDGGARVFRSCAALAAAVPQFRLLRPMSLEALPAYAATLPGLLAAANAA